MKKILILAVMVLTAFSAQAIPLFPFFVDVAGSYTDGTPQELEKLEVTSLYFSHPTYYAHMNEADDFLMDVLPFANEQIYKESMEVDGVKFTVYASPMENGRMSVIYLTTNPESKRLVVAYDEIIVNDLSR